MKKGDYVPLNEWLYRRSYCKPERNYFNPDGSATSRVFKLREKDAGKLSVDLKSKTTPEKAIRDGSKFMLFEVVNEAVVQNGLKTVYDPLDDGSNDAHALIVGMNLDDEVTPGLLARSSRRVVL